MRFKALLGVAVATAALAAVQLDAAALTSGTSLPTGNGSSVIVTGALDSLPSPVTAIDAEDICISDWIDRLIPPIEPSDPMPTSIPPLPLACMAAGLALTSSPTVTADATWVGVTSSAGGYVVTMACQATASVGLLTVDEPLSTTVNACYLHGADGFDYLYQGPVTLPGATAAARGVSLTLPVQRYQVCVVASASYVGGSAPTSGACN